MKETISNFPTMSFVLFYVKHSSLPGSFHSVEKFDAVITTTITASSVGGVMLKLGGRGGGGGGGGRGEFQCPSHPPPLYTSLFVFMFDFSHMYTTTLQHTMKHNNVMHN